MCQWVLWGAVCASFPFFHLSPLKTGSCAAFSFLGAVVVVDKTGTGEQNHTSRCIAFGNKKNISTTNKNVSSCPRTHIENRMTKFTVVPPNEFQFHGRVSVVGHPGINSIGIEGETVERNDDDDEERFGRRDDDGNWLLLPSLTGRLTALLSG